MNSLDRDFKAGLFDFPEPPCVSLYQPTHRSHPDNLQDPIRFRNLVKTLEESLRLKHDSRKTTALLKPFWQLAEDTEFWRQSNNGLVALGAASFFRVYRLQRPVPEIAIVAESFHLKPLLRILQSADRYHILALSRKQVSLFEGNRDAVAPVEFSPIVADLIDRAQKATRKSAHVEVNAVPTAPSVTAVRGGQGTGDDTTDHDTERYFRTVDRIILEHYSGPSGLPLLLAALPEHHTPFHKISRNSLLLKSGIEGNPEALSIDALRDRAWQMIEPHYRARLAGMADVFVAAKAKGAGDDDLEQVVKASAANRVGTLFIEADRRIPGRLDDVTGEVEFDDMAQPDVDDLLDDLAEKVLKAGGQVIVVPAERMPSDTGLAAIYRF